MENNETNKAAYQILRGNCKYFALGITEDEAVRSMVEFSTQKSKEKDEEIKRLRDFLKDCQTNLKMFNHNDLTDFERKMLEKLETI